MPFRILSRTLEDPARLTMDARALEQHLHRIVDVRNGVAINRETGRVIRACVPVHVFGHPADMDALLRVCGAMSIVVVEDAAQSLGSAYRGRPCGGLARAGVLSFNGNKIVTTGGGGAILTDDIDLAKRAKHLTTTAKPVPRRWAFVHDEVGWNYRLPNINAALGVAQLEELERFVAAKRRLSARYAAAFRNLPGLRLVEEPPETSSNYWLNAILLDDDSGEARDAVLEATASGPSSARPAWTPMHDLAMFAAAPRASLGVTETYPPAGYWSVCRPAPFLQWKRVREHDGAVTAWSGTRIASALNRLSPMSPIDIR